MKKLYCLICSKYRTFEKPKVLYILEKQLFLLFPVSVKIKLKNYLKKKNQFRYQKFLFYLKINSLCSKLVERSICD